MQYQTRHLEALTDIPMGDNYYTKGERFPASPTDCEYLVARQKARYVEEQKPVAEPPAAETTTPARRRGRPPTIRTEAEEQAPEPAAEDAPSGDA